MAGGGRPESGRVAVVTGASSGIGRLAARRFAEQGDRVVLAARSEGSLTEAVLDCTAAGGQAFAVKTDVGAYDQVSDLARQAVERFGRLDVWVNNAGVMAYGEVSEIPEPAHRRVMETNLFGTVYGSRVAVDHMDPAEGGVIINVASLYGRMTSPYVSPYVASKFGIVGFSEVLRQELAGSGIHVCTVLPGSMDTPIFRHAAIYGDRLPRPVPPVSDPERVARRIVKLADRPRAEITVGAVHRAMGWGRRFSPGVYGLLAPGAMEWLGLGREHPGISDGNLFEPMPEWNRAEGRWRNGAARVGVAAAAATIAAAGGFVALRAGAFRGGRTGPGP